MADAVLAADAGVDAIARSNHGGRQLGGAPATFDLVRPMDVIGAATVADLERELLGISNGAS